MRFAIRTFHIGDVLISMKKHIRKQLTDLESTANQKNYRWIISNPLRSKDVLKIFAPNTLGARRFVPVIFIKKAPPKRRGFLKTRFDKRNTYCLESEMSSMRMAPFLGLELMSSNTMTNSLREFQFSILRNFSNGMEIFCH